MAQFKKTSYRGSTTIYPCLSITLQHQPASLSERLPSIHLSPLPLPARGALSTARPTRLIVLRTHSLLFAITGISTAGRPQGRASCKNSRALTESSLPESLRINAISFSEGKREL